MNKILSAIKANVNDIIKPIVVLLSICIIIPLALSLTNKLTADRIEKLAAQTQTETMQLLIEADRFNERTFGEKDSFTYYAALKADETVGYVFVTAAKGYGGEVSVMTAVGTDATVKEIAILDATNETPGLGQNITKESFYSQYKGKKENLVLVKNGAVEENNELNAVTGATISSRAVTNAVNEALEQFKIVSALSSQAYPTESEVTVNE